MPLLLLPRGEWAVLLLLAEGCAGLRLGGRGGGVAARGSMMRVAVRKEAPPFMAIQGCDTTCSIVKLQAGGRHRQAGRRIS